MKMLKRTIIFLGNGRCYHTMDWFRSAQKLYPENPPILVTDLIDGEGFQKLLRSEDIVHHLFMLDQYLFRYQSHWGNMWRNLLKLLLIPIQILKLRKIVKKYTGAIIHAHSMYYIFLARFSGCTYVATPQGSEVLVRPYHSPIYKIFERTALSKAHCITVDSVAMQQSLKTLFGFGAMLIQNGIDVHIIILNE